MACQTFAFGASLQDSLRHAQPCGFSFGSPFIRAWQDDDPEPEPPQAQAPAPPPPPSPPRQYLSDEGYEFLVDEELPEPRKPMTKRPFVVRKADDSHCCHCDARLRWGESRQPRASERWNKKCACKCSSTRRNNDDQHKHGYLYCLHDV